MHATQKPEFSLFLSSSLREDLFQMPLWCFKENQCQFIYSPDFVCSEKERMSWLDEVPIKILLGSLGKSKKEVELVTAPEIIVPDYLKILQETEVEELCYV